MNKYPLIGKCLAVGIILLFIGVAIAPSINFVIVKASNDNDLVEVTTQACGIQGFGNTTVKLTREQYQNLEQYLVDFRARLNQTTTREEAVPIFKEAVVELNKYGLLPKGMSVDQAQSLVFKNFQNERITRFMNKRYNEQQLSNDSNFICLVVGEASNIGSFGFPYRLPICVYTSASRIVNFFFYKFNISLYFLDDLSYNLFWLVNNIAIAEFYLLSILGLHFPGIAGIKILNYLSFGYNPDAWYHGDEQPSQGWIYSNGLLGKRLWENSFYGNIAYVLTAEGSGFFAPWWKRYIGMAGFTGILVYGLPDGDFFLGTALRVNIDDSPPS